MTAADQMMNPSEPLRLGETPASATEFQNRALWWTNTYRARAGLGPLDAKASLNSAAAAHASYVLHNADLYEKQGLSVHEEEPSRAGFTGVRFWERMEFAAYDGAAFREVIAYQARPSAAVAHWMETVYHRLPLIHPGARHIGYAQVQNGANRINVLDIGAGSAGPLTIPDGIAWPAAGTRNVPVSWDGLESPQPPAPAGGYPSGPVVSLNFATANVIEVTRHEIVDVDQGGAALAHVLLTPNNDPHLKGESAVVLYTNNPLAPGHTYQVSIDGEIDGRSFSRSWRFTTRADVGCSLLSQDCGIGKACYGTSDVQSICAWEGVGDEGTSCTYQNDCGQGLTCVGQVCRHYCWYSPDGQDGCADTCGDGYSALDVQAEIGACRVPAGEEFALN
jgi:uncharacterized protein YkwD